LESSKVSAYNVREKKEKEKEGKNKRVSEKSQHRAVL